MSSTYSLADTQIERLIGEKLKTVRLKQNLTQESVAQEAQVSLSTVKKIERGEIGSFDAFLRLLRTLGKLDVLQPLIEEEELSPNEYYELVNNAKKKTRKRATGTFKPKRQEESEW
ncbi:MAG: helix-turn-helix domain-containing protein [Ruminococcus flavefaciens]|nr:helix-turn-helix domain-containing protein [Ruminococcus flavefaciens]